MGIAYNQTLAAAGGIPGYVWSLNPGSSPLPVGLSLNPSGVISGVATTAGTTIMTVKVTDQAGGMATKQLSLTISPVIPTVTITSPSLLPAGTVGTAYSTTLAASGGTGALSWSVVSGTLPGGVTLNSSTGQLSGPPTTPGTSTFTIRVRDSGTPQQSDEQAFTLAIAPSGGGGGGGGGGTLTVTNAPASVGGTFKGDVTSQSSGGVSWGENSTVSPVHIETFALLIYNLPGLTYQLVFASADPGVATGWTCVFPAVQDFITCSGVTINQPGGTLTLVNTVLSDVSGIITPPITLNGTLTFTPF